MIIFDCSLLSIVASVVAQSDKIGTTGDSRYIFWTTTIALIGVIFGNVWQYFRDKKTREWQKEDRLAHEIARDLAEASRQELREQVETVDKKIEVVKGATEEVKGKIVENTEITKEGAIAAKEGASAAIEAKQIVDEKVNQRLVDIDAKIENKFKALENGNGGHGGA